MGNVLFGVIPMITYGIVNLVALMLAEVDRICGFGIGESVLNMHGEWDR